MLICICRIYITTVKIKNLSLFQRKPPDFQPVDFSLVITINTNPCSTRADAHKELSFSPIIHHLFVKFVFNSSIRRYPYSTRTKAMNRVNVRVSKARVMHIKSLIKPVYTLHTQKMGAWPVTAAPDSQWRAPLPPR